MRKTCCDEPEGHACAFHCASQTVVTRRTQHELKKSEEKAHLLLGLKIALEHVDDVVKLIKQAGNC